MRALCVFCGSSPGVQPIFMTTARALGASLARRGIALVYGGARVGLMGAVADGALMAGGAVIGVLPRFLGDREIAHLGLTELIHVDSMHERKAAMAARSDGFVALPGGFGTLEELFEVLTWSQLNLHRKPCGIVNVDNFFDPLLAQLERAVESGFLRPSYNALLTVEREADALLDRMSTRFAAEPPSETHLDKT